jgi:RHS repeat-associated protein
MRAEESRHPTLARFIGQGTPSPPDADVGRRGARGAAVRERSQSAEEDDEASRGRRARGSSESAEAGATSRDWIPKIELPKGGGAIGGIGEKFEANAFTGSGSLSVPVPAPPARGLAPQLALSYASGGGNGPFGLGWSLGVPSITRKTERELPEYRDSVESDTFVLAGAEDLVPLRDGTGNRIVRTPTGFLVYPYLPRVEGLFARIERWVATDDGDTHWRVITKDNVTSWYGQTAQARVANPDDARLVFEWKIEETRDDRGNIVQYTYKPEDAAVTGTGLPAENNRAPSAGSYLKRIRYGNATPSTASGWMFELVFDYGEHGSIDSPTQEVVVTPNEDEDWLLRADAYSWFRAGFDIRMRRLCERILVFHNFTELDTGPVLVRSLDFTYDEAEHLAKLVEITSRSYEPGTVTNGYVAAEMPALELAYSSALLAPVLRDLDPRGLENLPDGVDGRGYRFADLEGEGLPGILTEVDGTLHYKRPRGSGRFGALERLAHQVTTAKLGAGAELRDVDGDGRLELAVRDGYYTRLASGDWASYVAFDRVPNIDLDDPNLQRIDLDGDGRVDLLLARDEHFLWYPSEGGDGWGEPRIVPKPPSERDGPALVFADGTRSIFFADMTGDGLSDLVRVTNGAVHYWPNLGRGRFGRRVTMDAAPAFTAPDLFDPQYVRLGDLDGSGTADLVYLDGRGARAWLNLSGNGFSAPTVLHAFPGVDSVTAAEIIDLYGKGTACLVWSTAADWAQPNKVLVLDLLPRKPHLLASAINNLGLETRLSWEPSTVQYLRDLDAGRPWITRLPFPVQLVTRVESYDAVARRRFVQRYAYHHGFFDGVERELRGFAMVERWDTESFEDFNHDGLFSLELFDTIEENLHQPPVLTRTWFHTGAFFGRQRISNLLANEYWSADAAAADWRLTDTVMPPGFRADESREACRALRGRMLRQELYALDGSAEEPDPYSLIEQNYTVVSVQPAVNEDHAVLFVHDRETVTMHYERLSEPDYNPRIAHSVVLDVDQWGNVTRSAAIAYPARDPATDVSEQEVGAVVVSEATFCQIDDPVAQSDVYRAGVPATQATFELAVNWTGWGSDPVPLLLDNATLAGATRVEPEATPTAGQLRLLSAVRSFYYTDDLTGALTLGDCGTRALPFETHTAALSEGQRSSVFGTDVTSTLLTTEGGYASAAVHGVDVFWARSGRQVFDDEAFYVPVTGIDPFDNETTITWDDHTLFVESLEDELGNVVTAAHDYRVLAPAMITDPNGNRTAVAFDTRGVVVAMALMGKSGASEGDTLEDPTSTFEYDPFTWRDEQTPIRVRTQARETYGDPGTRWIERISYFDGSGNVILDKVTAEPGLAPDRDENGALVIVDGQVVLVESDPRWVGTGRTVFDNKGNPVKQYEPYFSSTDAFEDETEVREQGVTPILHYDPLGRLVRTDFPDGTFSLVEFTPWLQRSYDRNDTAMDSQWYLARIGLTPPDPEQRAAELTEAHHDTPTVTHLDPLGRAARVIEDLGSSVFALTRSVLDVQGNVLEVINALEVQAEERTYGMLGQPLRTDAVEVGERRMATTVLGEPLRMFDALGRSFRFQRDELRRPTHHWMQPAVGDEVLLTRIVYGEIATSPADDNLRGRVLRTYDSAGLVANVSFDFAGNLLEQTRQLAIDYETTPDWVDLASETTLAGLDTAGASLLEAEVFTTSGTFDAFGRPVTRTTPDASVTAYTYNDAGLLESVEAAVRGAMPATTFVSNIDYDVHGRRALIEYGNGTATSYEYDPVTFRLRRVLTERSSPAAVLQDLQYTYDPVGNIVEIRDDAQQTVYFDNSVVDPHQQFVYDALYRLIEATGREHISQGQPTHSELTPGPQPETSDPAALRLYVESYTYDLVGNVLEVEHEALSSPAASWTRGYHYDPPNDGNRLLATSLPGDDVEDPETYSAEYTYDDHGNMLSMPHLAAVAWDPADRMQHCDLGGGGDVWFVYDAGGNRVRKVWVSQTGTTVRERIYLGEYEVWREHSGSPMDVQQERETLHVSDDAGRLVMVETLTIDEGDEVVSPANVARYQYGNHLGTVALELDDAGEVISYEEFHPYGSSAYRAVSSGIEVSAKRYRYAGKERDEETGLDHMGARYYAAWLGRWTAADPIGLGDGVNRYAYVRGNPTRRRDPSGMSGAPAEDDTMAGPTVHRRSELSRLPTEAERAAAQRVRDDAALREVAAGLVGQYEASLRVADQQRMAELQEAADASLTGAYLTGRIVSDFEPGQLRGPTRVQDFAAKLGRDIRKSQGSLTERVEALGERFRYAVDEIDWHMDIVEDAQGTEAALTIGGAVAARAMVSRSRGGATAQKALPDVSASTRRDAQTLIKDSNPDFPLSETNAIRAVQGPQGSVPTVKGPGGAGADVEFRTGPQVLRREVKSISGGFNSFNQQVSHAARQVKMSGEILVQVPGGTDAAGLVGRFNQARAHNPAALGRYRSVEISIVDPEGNVLFSGPLVR